jgi:hypothetical protein
MTITSPITITPPPIKHKDGTVKTFPPITLTSLDIVYTDDPKNKIVRVQIRPCPLPLTLWSGAAYDAIGNWTEAQAEAQITTLLGSSPATVLLGLFPAQH